MTVEEALTAALVTEPALAGVKAYPEIGQGTEYIVYTQFFGQRPVSLSGSAPLANPRFQIDAYAGTRARVVALKNAIRRAIEGAAALNAVFLNDGSGFEPDTKLYRHRQDFSIWFNE